jgi:hypothetical protein
MKSGIRNMARGAAVVAVLTMLTACGGGDSGPPTYTVGGTVTGLSGPGLVLQNGGGDDLPISASGAFTFATRMPSGTSYAVIVKSSPTSPLQACLVADGVGTIAATDVTNVSVTCENGHTVGGTVSGLQGSGLVLQLFAPGRRGPGPGGGTHSQGITLALRCGSPLTGLSPLALFFRRTQLACLYS